MEGDFRLTRMGATQLKRRHKTHPVKASSSPQTYCRYRGGRIAMTTISLVGFAGFEPTTNRLWGGGFTVKLKAHVQLASSGKRTSCTNYYINNCGDGESCTHDFLAFSMLLLLSYVPMFPHLFVFPADRNIPAKNLYDFYSLILYAPPRTYRNGANSGNWTRTFCLEGRCSTIKLYRQKR